MLRSIVILAALLAISSESLLAQAPLIRDQIEVGALAYQYDQGIAPWRGLTASTQFARRPGRVWRGQAVIEERFGEPSFLYEVGHTASVGRMILRGAASTSSGGFYNPRYRVDAQVGAKLFKSRRLVFLLGGFHRSVRDGHFDSAAIGEMQWYASGLFVFQTGVRYQLSNPGSATSLYYDGALTVGRSGRSTVTLHAGYGGEAYQIIDPLVIYTDFKSASAQVSWRQWVRRGAGFELSASYYENPYYQRSGARVTFFFPIGSRR
jgi:YaiO family outer membrane protein